MRTTTWIQESGTTKDTFYPRATKCYRDPTHSSCFLFGNSGSGVVRPITPEEANVTQYAYTGPLSMSKSCDNIIIYDNKITYGSENPGIFTDAYCYLAWIAAMYRMVLPDGYTSYSSCGQSNGERRNINLGSCVGRNTTNLGVKECDFSYVDKTSGVQDSWDKCRLFSQEGYAYNIYICKVVLYLSHHVQVPLHLNLPQDQSGNNMTCANNCRGVDPNSVIIGGGAVLAASAVGGLSFFGLAQSALGLGAVAAAAGGMALTQCPASRPCRVLFYHP